MPSLPNSIKSVSDVVSKVWISGVAIMQFGFPPYLSILAIQSPKVLLTERRPGITLIGGTTLFPFESIIFTV